MRVGPIPEVAEGSLPDLAVSAVALAQQDGRGEFRLGTGSIDNQFLDEDISVNGGDGIVTNAGALRLAAPDSIAGYFAQTGAGALDVEIAGTGPDAFGNLAVSGAVSLAGGLAVELLDGFALAAGDSFDILDFASLSGDFTSFTFDSIACSSGGSDVWDCADLEGGRYFAEAISGTSLDLLVVADPPATAPEPGTLAILAAGLAGLGMARARRTAIV